MLDAKGKTFGGVHLYDEQIGGLGQGTNLSQETEERMEKGRKKRREEKRRELQLRLRQVHCRGRITMTLAAI